MFRDIFGGHSWNGGLLPISRVQRPGMLSHSLQHKDSCPQQRIMGPKMSGVIC